MSSLVFFFDPKTLTVEVDFTVELTAVNALLDSALSGIKFPEEICGV